MLALPAPAHAVGLSSLCDGFRNCTTLSVRIFGIPGPCVCESPYSLTFICNPRWLLGALPRPLGRVQRGGNRACPLGWAVAPGPVPAPTVNTCPFSCVLSATFPAFLCFFLVISLLTAPEPGPKVRLVFPRAGGCDVPSGENACVSRASSGRGTALPAEPGVHEPAACVKVSVNRSAHSTGSVRPLPSRRWPGAQGPGPACPRSRGQRPLTPYSVTLQNTTTSNGEDGCPSSSHLWRGPLCHVAVSLIPSPGGRPLATPQLCR